MKTPALVPISGKTNKQQTHQPPSGSFRVCPREIFVYGQKPNPLTTIRQAPLWFGPNPVPLLSLPPHSPSFLSIHCFNQTNQTKPNLYSPNPLCFQASMRLRLLSQSLLHHIFHLMNTPHSFNEIFMLRLFLNIFTLTLKWFNEKLGITWLIFDNSLYTGSGRSKACLSVVGRVIIWV